MGALLRIVAAVLAAILFSVVFFIVLALESARDLQAVWTGAPSGESVAPAPTDRVS